jgi:hypothetical protein
LRINKNDVSLETKVVTANQFYAVECQNCRNNVHSIGIYVNKESSWLLVDSNLNTLIIQIDNQNLRRYGLNGYLDHAAPWLSFIALIDCTVAGLAALPLTLPVLVAGAALLLWAEDVGAVICRICFRNISTVRSVAPWLLLRE